MRRLATAAAAVISFAMVGLLAAPGAQAANYYRGISWYWLNDVDCG